MKLAGLAGLFLSLLILVSGCASSPDGMGRNLTGVSGPVEWEVTDVGRVERPDGMRSRWSYTILLREKAGMAIQFERIERGAQGHTLETSSVARIPFSRRLEPRAELRYSAVDSWGWVSYAATQFGGTAALGSLTIERRFIGRDSRGQEIVVPVRVELHRGFGRRSRQPSSQDQPLPPTRHLQAGELTSLAGRWEGYYQEVGFQVPVAAVIGNDGSVEIAENDPVTNRFRASVSIRDGRVWYSGRETGEYVLHQDGARQVLALPAE